ncbi:MAG: hypothetical protein ACLTAO_01030 [Christensenellales bacterium]
MTCEIMLTVAMGKRLIARGLMADGQVQDAMRNHKLLIIGGSTNGYVAEEALRALGDGRAFDKRGFRRGVTAAPGAHMQAKPCGFDMLIDHGKVFTDRDVFAAAPDMGEGDMIMKGANALYLPGGEAGVLIGHPQGGTVIPTITAEIGRRVSVVVPVGLEKRVEEPIAALAAIANSSEATARGCSTAGAHVYRAGRDCGASRRLAQVAGGGRRAGRGGLRVAGRERHG